MRRLGLLLSALLLLAGCGVPEDDRPTPLDPAAAPFRVFEREEEPTQQGDLLVELWFVRGDRLVPVERAVELPGTPQRVLGTLFEGVTAQEREAGLSSLIPATVQLEGVTVEDGIAVVDLEDLDEQVQLQLLPVAQIVATLTGRPQVRGVRFRSGGDDLDVPQGDSSLTDAPVDRQAYAELLGLAPPADAVLPTAEPSPQATG